MERKTVYVACIPFLSGGFPPYVYGLLRAYAETEERIRENYDFDGSLCKRIPVLEMVAGLEHPTVLAVSCYLWNFRISMELCRATKARFPGCLVVAGGPHIPDRPADFFEKHPYVDVLVHGEGEITFRNLLLQVLDDPEDFSAVKGVTFRRRGAVISTGPGEKLPRDIDVPSPYLMGYLDPHIEAIKASGPIGILWETNRGCPYGCTFCDWGSATQTKIRQFRMDRLAAEIEYFARIGVEYIATCDANFGILPRDEEITHLLIRTKAKTGHPSKFAVNYAKNSNARVFDIASRLYEAKMLINGITLSMQSVDPTVLKEVKRATIGVENYQDLQRRYNENGIPTYTELILGLPLETKETWVTGICGLIDRGHDDLRPYGLQLLPNSKVSEPAERAKYRFGTMSWTVIPEGKRGEPEELTEVVTSTSTLPFEDWVDGTVFASLFARCLHSGGYTKFLARFLLRREGVQAGAFYRALFAVAKRSPESTLGWITEAYSESLRRNASGEYRGVLDHAVATHPALMELLSRYPQLQNGYDWDVPAFMWLWLSENLDGLYSDVAAALVVLNLAPETGACADALRFARDVMLTLDYDPNIGKVGRYAYDWHRYFFGDGALVRGHVEISFTDSKMGVNEIALERGNRRAFFFGAGMTIDVHGRCHHQGRNMRVLAFGQGELVELQHPEVVASRRADDASGRKHLPIAST